MARPVQMIKVCFLQLGQAVTTSRIKMIAQPTHLLMQFCGTSGTSCSACSWNRRGTCGQGLQNSFFLTQVVFLFQCLQHLTFFNTIPDRFVQSPSSLTLPPYMEPVKDTIQACLSLAQTGPTTSQSRLSTSRELFMEWECSQGF